VIGNEWPKFKKWQFGEFGEFCISEWRKREPGGKKILNLPDFVDDVWNMHNLHAQYLTTFVTCQLLVLSPTYFEILYDLVGSKKFVACY
jgi:hypothetical protein